MLIQIIQIENIVPLEQNCEKSNGLLARIKTAVSWTFFQFRISLYATAEKERIACHELFPPRWIRV
jgi:hypothetical protein